MKQITVRVRYNKFVAVPKNMGSSGLAPMVDTYITYIKDNGEKIYILNNNLISMAEGNAHYKAIKYKYGSDHTNYFEDPIYKIDMNDDEFIDELSARIDNYTEYIDDPKQWKSVVESNKRVYAIIKKVAGVE